MEVKNIQNRETDPGIYAMVTSCNGNKLNGRRVVRVASCQVASCQSGELSEWRVVRVASCQGGKLSVWRVERWQAVRWRVVRWRVVRASLQNILRNLSAKFPSEHGNCEIRTWEFGWKNLHVQYKWKCFLVWTNVIAPPPSIDENVTLEFLCRFS
jgi:hypothetical protein